ncbi:galactosyltransferase domain-containing protein [Ditylenchus destructor]|uniref:Hexosyltransferase n=1 Tax=Ditylenchus destructor TaxID=166010 RepID=A0AAD4QYG7_9BILA|nr:galactosyltransferase domain-containing protein [Ditylenchus destructor]
MGQPSDFLYLNDWASFQPNNTLKFIHSIGLAKEYCGAEQPIPYLLLLDDDYLLSFKNLAVEAQRHAPNERLYMGWRFVSSPFRLFFWKHRVALDEYPFAAYPPYISAGAVFMTGQTIKEFYLAIQYVKLYKFDDIYAGILSYFLGITAQHNENFPYYRVKTANEEEEVRLWKSGIAMHDYRPYELLEIYPRMAAVQNQNSTNT